MATRQIENTCKILRVFGISIWRRRFWRVAKLKYHPYFKIGRLWRTAKMTRFRRAANLADRQNRWILADRQNGTNLAGLARSVFSAILGTLDAFCKDTADAKRANAELDSQFQKIPPPLPANPCLLRPRSWRSLIFAALLNRV